MENAIIHGYGYQRTRQELTAAGASQVWIDTAPTRPERNTMLTTRQAIRPHRGDRLIVMHEADLGEDWRDRKRVRDLLDARGIPLTILDSAPPGRKDPGRPKMFDPTSEQDAEFGAVWYGPYTAAYLKAEYRRIFGEEWTAKVRGRVHAHYGPRDGSRWRDSVPRAAAE